MILVAVVLVGIIQQPTIDLGVQCGRRHQGCQPKRKHEDFQILFLVFILSVWSINDLKIQGLGFPFWGWKTLFFVCLF